MFYITYYIANLQYVLKDRKLKHRYVISIINKLYGTHR